MTDLTITRRVIELGETGARGRDGVSGDFLTLTQTNASGSAIQAEVEQDGAAYGVTTAYRVIFAYETTADTISLEVAGVNTGDPRLLKTADGVNLAGTSVSPGDSAVVVGRLVDPTDPTQGFTHWEILAPGIQTATNAETRSRTRTDVAVTPAALGDFVEATLAPLDFALRYGTPNASGKIVAIKAGVRRWLMRAPLKYDAGINPSNSDYAEYEMQDMGPFQTPTMTRGWCLNSIRQVVDGRLILLSHFSIESVSGSTWNTKLAPSTMEFAIEMGENGTTVNGTNYPFKGFGHGGMGYVSSQFFINGSSAVDYADPANSPVGTLIWCDSASFQQIFTILIGSAIACRTNLTHDFISDQANGQCRIEHTHDFTHASVTAVDPCIRTGYCHMLPATGVDFVKAAGVSAVDIVADADGNIAHGKTTQLALYRSTVPTALVEVILSYGFPMRIGTSVGTLADDDWTYCDPSQYVVTLRNSGYGSKTYFAFCTQPGGGTDVDSFAGKVVRCQAYYRVKSGTPA